jgi:hypothetical protein
MSKIHLRQGTDGTPACACAGLDAKTLKIIRNSRATYQQMSSISVSPEEFRAVNPKDRCSHCCDRFTSVMNARRRLSGKPLYKDAMTKELL